MKKYKIKGITSQDVCYFQCPRKFVLLEIQYTESWKKCLLWYLDDKNFFGFEPSILTMETFTDFLFTVSPLSLVNSCLCFLLIGCRQNPPKWSFYKRLSIGVFRVKGGFLKVNFTAKKFRFINDLWWRTICSYCAFPPRPSRDLLSHICCTYVDTRLSLPSLKYTVVARLLTCLHLSTSGDPAFDFTRGHSLTTTRY
jgi:hypothetical protein